MILQEQRHVRCVRPADYGGLRLNCMQPLHAMPGIGHSITLTMPDFKGTLGDTLWREGGVRCVLVPAGAGTAVELRSEHGGVFLRKLAPGVLTTAVSRPPAALTA